jgi:hypothetical protein
MRAVLVRPTWLVAAAVVTASACSDVPTEPTVAPILESVTGRGKAMPTLAQWLAVHGGANNASMLVGAGDIAECYQGSIPTNPDPAGSAAAATADLLAEFPEATVIAVGDNAYQYGSPADYNLCYQPTWGAEKERTRPAAGNHEYMTPGAAGYFAYYWVQPPQLTFLPNNGYYSYNVGSWHVVVLNSTPQVYACYPPELGELEQQVSQQDWWQALWGDPQLNSEPRSAWVGRLCAGDPVQQAWLVADLKAHSNYQCTAVYFHHPRFSSGQHGNHYQMQRIWDILYLFGVDLAITGHDHNYERFAPQDLNGRRDRRYGIRQFVVGTGGADLRGVNRRIRNSEVVITGVHGVLAAALEQGGYSWAFVDVDKNVRDSGSDRCHNRPRWRRGAD